MTVQQIQPRFVPKVWGSLDLEPWFPNQREKIGEVWFPSGDLLIKFLFTTEPLSVQVHPDDQYAARHENSRGKTEMWHILRSAPDAQVALGFKEPITAEQLLASAHSGAVMEKLQWQNASPGETFFTPAGSVHAIGAGLALCEIQQNSDVTYRIYDYGRARELHLERALDVSDLGTHPGASVPRPLSPGHELLVACRHFTAERLCTSERTELAGDRVAIILEGTGLLDGHLFRAGTVWELPAGRVSLEPVSPCTLLLARRPV